MRHLLYQNSGDIDNHDHRKVVGYHAFAVLRRIAATGDDVVSDGRFTLSVTEKERLKTVARESIRSACDGTAFSSAALCRDMPTLEQPCGAFVTLNKNGRLRGCIGHFGEDAPLHATVAEMARAAAFEDPRFPRLRADELPDVDIEISVLTPMRRIHSLDEFELHRHGLYIKAGLGWDGWRDAELYVYEAIVF